MYFQLQRAGHVHARGLVALLQQGQRGAHLMEPGQRRRARDTGTDWELIKKQISSLGRIMGLGE